MVEERVKKEKKDKKDKKSKDSNTKKTKTNDVKQDNKMEVEENNNKINDTNETNDKNDKKDKNDKNDIIIEENNKESNKSEEIKEDEYETKMVPKQKERQTDTQFSCNINWRLPEKDMKECIDFEKRMILDDKIFEESNQSKNNCESLIYLYKDKI